MQTFPAGRNEDSGQARGLLPESDGGVWAATQLGLARLKNGERKLLTTRNGLPCNEIFALVKDDRGSLWLYTKCGLVVIEPAELRNWWNAPRSILRTRTFDIFDGAQPGLTPLQPQAARSKDGRLWFANKSIVQMIDPNLLERDAPPPPVHVEKIFANRKGYTPRKLLQLPPLTRDLEIDYAALSFIALQKVQYRYRLEGYDHSWQEPRTRREALYSGLPPGSYHFQVIASNSDGVWSTAGATQDFEIAPMFYQTKWFLGVCLLAAAGCLWLLYARRLRQVSTEMQGRFEERLAERMRIARELHDTLLQNITGLSLQLSGLTKLGVSPDSAQARLSDLKRQAEDCLREARQSVWDIRSSDSETVDFVSALRESGEQFTAGKPTEFLFEVDGEQRPVDADVRLQLLRIGREAIGNAAHHAQASRIEARLFFDPATIGLRISDNGAGFNLAEAEKLDGHFGLVTMRERAQQIGARLTISSKVGQGTCVEILLPTA